MHCIVLVPAKATTPTLFSSTTTSITIQWEEVSEGSLQKSYFILWTPGNSGSTKSTSYNAENLQPNTAYTFTITARNAAGIGQPSDEATFPTSVSYAFTVAAMTRRVARNSQWGAVLSV